MGSVSDKLIYLNGTKSKLKDSINLTGTGITDNDTFRSYASRLKNGYIDIINNGIDILYSNFPKVSKIGSNLSLTPTYAAPMRNLPLGNTLQDGTPTPDNPVEVQSATGLQKVNICGKNLFDKDNINEIRGTINAASNIFTYSSTSMNYCFYMSCKPNTTYTIQKRNDGDVNRFKFASCSTPISTQESSVTTLTTGASDDSANYLTIITGTNDRYLLAQYYRSAETALTKQEILDSIQIEESLIATEYEPYKCDTYEVNLGKNLLNPNRATTGQNGITFTNNGNGTYTVTGTSTGNVGISITTDNIILEKDTYYTQSIKTISGTQTGAIVPAFKNSQGQTSYNYFNNNQTRLTTDTMTLKSYDYYVASGNTVNWTFAVQLEKGSIATSYSPYFTPIELNEIDEHQDGIKKSNGKNLFDLNRTLGVPSDATSTNTTKRLFDYNEYVIGIAANNYYSTSYLTNYSVSNNSISVTNLHGAYGLGVPVKVKANTTYKLSYSTNVSANQNTGVGFYSSDGTHLGFAISMEKNNYLDITTPDNCYFMVIVFRPPATSLTYSNVMLNEGTTALPYEPYGKVWYVEKQTKIITLKSSDIWNYVSGTHPRFTNSSINDIALQEFNNNAPIVAISNYFTGSNWYNVYTNASVDNAICSHDAVHCLTIKATQFTDLASFKSFLDSNNVEVIYVLSTPTITEITNTELINQLEELYTALSHDDTTNIFITSENLPMKLNASALKNEI